MTNNQKERISTSDTLVRAIADNNNLRVSAAVTTNLVQEAHRRHQTSALASAALGRVLTASLLLSWNLKERGTITLRVFGDGPLGGVIADVNALGQVRGYVHNSQVDLPLKQNRKLDVGSGIGQGELYVTTDLDMKEPYTSSISLVSGEIGEDLAQYLLVSEQTPSLVAVGVLVNPDLSIKAAGGIIIQALPDSSPRILEQIEANLQSLKPLSTLVSEGADAQAIIEHYLQAIEIKILEQKSVSFFCSCNRSRLEKVIISLGSEELEDIIINDGQCRLKCHFCNQDYLFSKQELKQLLEEAKKQA